MSNTTLARWGVSPADGDKLHADDAYSRCHKCGTITVSEGVHPAIGSICPNPECGVDK